MDRSPNVNNPNCSCDAGTIRSTIVRGFRFYRPWTVMAAANARAEAAIITRSGFTADFADFAIAVPSDRRKRGAYFLQND
jgi:hypothetical protein